MLQYFSKKNTHVYIKNSKYGSCLFKNNENIYRKGRALMQMYRVVPQTCKGIV